MRGMNDKTRIETINLVRQIEPDIDWSKSKNRQLLRSFFSPERRRGEAFSARFNDRTGNQGIRQPAGGG